MHATNGVKYKHKITVLRIGELIEHTSGTILSITIVISVRTSLSQFSHNIRDAVVCLTIKQNETCTHRCKVHSL